MGVRTANLLYSCIRYLPISLFPFPHPQYYIPILRSQELIYKRSMQRQKTESDFVLYPAHSSDCSSNMLALDSSRRQFFAQQQLPIDPVMMDPFGYPPMEQEDFHALSQRHDSSRSIPQSYYDTPSMYVESAPDMHKTLAFPPVPSTPPSMATSHFSEHMPTLSSASGPSIASASSSAIGSPYSAAAHGYSENWIDTNHGLGLPAAVMTDLVSNEYNQIAGGVDPDSAFAPEKFQNNFVGESDRISSHVQSSLSVSSFPVEESGAAAVAFNAHRSPTSSRMVMSTSCSSSRSSIAALSSPKTPVSKSPVMAPPMKATWPSMMPSPWFPTKRHSLDQSILIPGVKRPRPSPSLSPESSTSSAAAIRPRVLNPPIEGHFQRSFFGQSSGNFVPPLESSCSFAFAPALRPFVLVFISFFPLLYVVSRLFSLFYLNDNTRFV
jgi:hypothetical protein